MPAAVLELLGDAESAAASSHHRWDIDEQVIVGRGGQSSIVLNVPAISRHHIQITPRPDGWWAADLESRNGTFLNGISLTTDPVRLTDSDVLVLAGSISLRFRDPLATPIAPAIGKLAGVWIDESSNVVWVDAQRLEPPLTARQFRLLKTLYDADGEVVSRADAIDATWDDVDAEGVTDDALAALIKRLRKRLEPLENGPRSIEIVKHRGIRLRNVP